jgi:hypothetical protein
MDRRKFLIGAGSLAAGSAAAVGTGAFTSVAAKRSVDIDVADDSNALLAFQNANSRNGEYADTSGGTLSIDISGSNDSIMGQGVNDNAQTVFRDVFDIKNQGTNGVFVSVNESPDGFGLFADYPANTEPGGGKPRAGPNGPSTGLGEGESGADCLLSQEPLGDDLCSSIPARVYLGPGQTLREIGFVIDTSGDYFGGDAPVSGIIEFRAQDRATFEGSVSRVNPHTVRVTDPSP